MADTLLGMHRNIIWVAAANTTLSAAITGVGDATVGLADYSALVDASPTIPARLEIGNERLHATTPGPTAAVLRAQEKSTAAAHTSGTTVKVLRGVCVLKTADWTPNADIQDIPIPGDGTVEHIFRLQGLTGTLTANKWDEDVLRIAMGVPSVTGGIGIPTDMDHMLHPQMGSYPVCEQWIELIALDGDANDAEVTERIILWAVKFQKPFVPGAAGNNALQGTPINWSANPVTADLFGRPIPGATGAIHYSMGKVVGPLT